MKAKGELRHQYHHAIDLVPTVLDVPRGRSPRAIKGHVQSRFDGVSMRYSFDDAKADSARKTQFYSMLGSRGIWHEGWKAVTTHPTISGWSEFNADEWELYHTDVDRSELHDLAAEQPGQAAGARQPVVRRSRRQRRLPARRPLRARDHHDAAPAAVAAAGPLPLLPRHAEVPEAQAVNVRNRSFAIGAQVDIPAAGAQGVLFAHGSRFGGHALYIKGNRLHYVNSFVGMFEQRIDATEDLPTGETHPLRAFEKDGEDPPHVATGILSLYHGDKKVGEGRIKTQPGMFSLAGEGLCIGRDSAEPITDDYPGESPSGIHGRHHPPGRGRRQRRALRRHGARGAADADARMTRHPSSRDRRSGGWSE